ncbi:MAG: hypothetical protein KJ048_10335 [Dehalococcoidia bacterium]|nr:hypothetical protein [Dehalococcoidia bacterium]
MSRRGGQLPWGAGSSPGLYGGRRPGGGYGRLAMLAAIVVGVLVIAFFLVSRACGSAGGCDDPYCPSDRNIAAPEGYQFVSKIFAYNEESGAVQPGFDLVVQVALSETVGDGQSLSFYRYVEETRNWEPLAPAIPDAQGKVVSATFTDVPAVMAVMRRNTPGGSVAAYLPHNARLHPEAEGHVTLVHPIDFSPAADGAVQGELSAITSDGSFEVYPVIAANASSQGAVAIVEGILASPAARTNHVRQVVAKLAEVNVRGVDIAYLDLPATQRTSFSLFVGELYEALHAQNKQLTLTLPAPIKAQNRIDEGAYDWAALAKTADLIKVAPFRDQAKYRLDMPEILAYLAERVTPAKLLLTVSPYATETGGDTIATYKLTDAMNIASQIAVRADADSITTSTNVEVAGTNIDRDENLSGVRWFAETATVAFSYKQAQGGGSRTVYIENFFSIGFKLELIPTYRLGGVAIDDASDDRYLGNIWNALVPFITSGQPILLRPNDADLEPKWAASGGTMESTRRGTANWFTPGEPGTYTISLTLSDGVAMFENSVPVNVKARDTRTPVATTTPGN